MDNCTNLHVYAGYNISNYKKSGRISDSEWDFLILDPWQLQGFKLLDFYNKLETLTFCDTYYAWITNSIIFRFPNNPVTP